MIKRNELYSIYEDKVKEMEELFVHDKHDESQFEIWYALIDGDDERFGHFSRKSK